MQHHDAPKHRSASPTDYWPLVAVILVAGAAALALSVSQMTLHAWMPRFMGIFFVIFSLLKLFDLPGFADGFQMYDLLAKRVRVYALIYPFLELGLGLAYLARWEPRWTAISTVVLMTFGATGVGLALKTGLDVRCACMGTSLRVPLSTVAVVEDVGMAIMAAGMLWSAS